MGKPLLPQVTAETAAAVRAELLKSGGYVVKIAERLERENPYLINFIGHFIQRFDQKEAEAAVYLSLLVYRLLESQAEADRMREVFGGEK